MSESNGRYALFLGCTIPYKLPQLEAATRFVMEKLGLEFVDLPFGCCPDPNGIHSYSEDTWYTLATRNLALAEEQGLDIITLCNGCYETLHYVNQKLKNDAKKLARINSLLAKVNQEYKASISVIHLHEFLHEKIGYDKLSQMIVNPLSNFRISVHYGCHALRPQSIGQPENAEAPQWLWDFVENVIQAEPIHYVDETLCCGAGIREMDQSASFDITKHKIVQMETAGANAITVPCPTCFLQYDGSQKLILREESVGTQITGTPTFYFTELLAIAMGADPKAIGISYHLMKPEPGLLKSSESTSVETSPNEIITVTTGSNPNS